MKNIGFLGCGNMGSAIMRGIINAGTFTKNAIFVFDPDKEKMNSFAESTGVIPVANEAGLVLNSDIIMLCIKPQKFSEVLPKIKENIGGKLVISIAAGKNTESIGELIGKDKKICRIFPNLNANVNAAVSAYCGNENASSEDLAQTGAIAASFGDAIILDEKNFSCFGVLGGCVPAFAFMFIDALRKTAEENGLNPDVAYKASCQAVLGSAKLLKEKGGDMEQWVKRVCSPGGTTIEGVTSLREDGFEESVRKAFEKSLEIDKELQSK